MYDVKKWHKVLSHSALKAFYSTHIYYFENKVWIDKVSLELSAHIIIIIC